MTVANGMIRRLLEHRGFGFIQSEDGRKVFFHRSEVLQVPFAELQDGQVVEFAVEETPPRAEGTARTCRCHSPHHTATAERVMSPRGRIALSACS
jgi:cold shock CspA family protein